VVRLEPQPAALLALLAANAGEVVTHERIRQAIWGDATHVNFRESVHYCIRQVRLALGDRARASRYIDTIPRRGYRLKAGVLAAGDADRLQPPVSRPARRLLCAAAVALIAAGAAVLEQRPNNHHHIAVALLRTAHDLVF
jgi:DNA-binding winged helix-turn-helix (wHTH) protein